MRVAFIRLGVMGHPMAAILARAGHKVTVYNRKRAKAEAWHFVKHAGLDPAAVIGAISKGAAQSWQMENRWETMVNHEFDFGFAVEWMCKDLRIALEEAGTSGATLEMTGLVDGFYEEVQKLGGNRWDTSSLIARLEK